jgi:hypothetical protein
MKQKTRPAHESSRWFIDSASHSFNEHASLCVAGGWVLQTRRRRYKNRRPFVRTDDFNHRFVLRRVANYPHGIFSPLYAFHIFDKQLTIERYELGGCIHEQAAEPKRPDAHRQTTKRLPRSRRSSLRTKSLFVYLHRQSYCLT